jgi:hypothetical protein
MVVDGVTDDTMRHTLQAPATAASLITMPRQQEEPHEHTHGSGAGCVTQLNMQTVAGESIGCKSSRHAAWPTLYALASEHSNTFQQ